MKKADQNRINMVTAVINTVYDPKHKDIWKDHLAFKAGVEATEEGLAAVEAQLQLSEGRPGARQLKTQAERQLCRSACEVLGAVRSYAAKISDPELAARMRFSKTGLLAGKVSEVVARCRNIHDAATEHLEALGDHGLTAAKLLAFKKKIDAFDGVKTAPRQNRVTQSGATQLLPHLVRSTVAILKEQVDGLMIQFQDAHPNFYEEYFAARVVVDQRSGRAGSAEAGPATVASKAA